MRLDEHEEAQAAMPHNGSDRIDRIINALLLIIAGAAVSFYAIVYILGYFG